VSGAAVAVEVLVIVVVSGSRVVVPEVDVVDAVSVVDVVISVVVVDTTTDVVVVDVVVDTVVVVVTEVVAVVTSSPNTMAQWLPEHHLPEPSDTSC